MTSSGISPANMNISSSSPLEPNHQRPLRPAPSQQPDEKGDPSYTAKGDLEALSSPHHLPDQGDPTDIDSCGRRPLRFGGKEEALVLFALFASLFAAGWNDASFGPLLLTVREHYNVSFTIVSLTYVCNFCGFFTAALINVFATDRLGFGKVITMGACIQTLAYALQSWAPPFPLFCFSYYITGIGMGLQDAQANAFCAILPNMMWKMSILHAVYGFGALVSPLVATQFAQLPQRWSFHFLTSLGICFFNVLLLLYTFRLRTEQSLVGKHHVVQASDDTSTATLEGGELESGAKLRDILKTKIVHVLAFFTLIYVGLEVTIGGWITTYIVETRGGGPSAGYIPTGFFGGITLGRIVLIPVVAYLGPKTTINLFALLCLGLQMIVWFVPSLVGGAVAVSFIGLLLGPFYVIIMNTCTRVLPRRLAGGAIGFIASFGQAGSAVFPFVTGALADKYGTWVLNPVVVGMLGGCVSLWLFTPRQKRS